MRWLVWLVVLLGSCVDDGDSSVISSRVPIINGEPALGEEGTIYIESLVWACSGSVIAPTVILTANHCVEGTSPSEWSVYLGHDASLEASVEVIELVRPGIFVDYSSDDLALMVLASAIDVPPYVAAASIEPDVVGSEVKIVGYGLDERGGFGVRLSATMTVSSTRLLWMELRGESYPGSGDSGGPVVDERGQVIGVISRSAAGDGIATRVDAFRWLIDPVLRREGACVQGDPELCDGVDNDCDLVVDEGCAEAGEPCETDAECPTGHCVDVEGVRICTAPCEIGDDEACWAGAYCQEVGCGEGWCRPGEPGDGALGDECGDDLECTGLMCRDPGDGRARCTERCEPDAAGCEAGFGCAVLTDGCGGCFVLEGSTWPRGLGEDCSQDAECRSGVCLTSDDGLRRCSRPCGESEPPCPETLYCRGGMCIPQAEAGQRCLSDEDCAQGFCWLEAPYGSVCTEACSETHRACFDRASCDEDLSLCRPWDSPLGGPCELDGEVGCTEGQCIPMEDEASICTRPCREGCPHGLECRDDVSVEPLCWPLAPTPGEEGCACSSACPRAPLAILHVVAGLAWERGRDRRRVPVTGLSRSWRKD